MYFLACNKTLCCTLAQYACFMVKFHKQCSVIFWRNVHIILGLILRKKYSRYTHAHTIFSFIRFLHISHCAVLITIGKQLILLTIFFKFVSINAHPVAEYACNHSRLHRSHWCFTVQRRYKHMFVKFYWTQFVLACKSMYVSKQGGNKLGRTK